MINKIFFTIVLFYSTTSIFAQNDNYFGPTSTGDYGSEGAGYDISTGDYNVALGDSAAFGLTSGLYNVFLGYQAGILRNQLTEQSLLVTKLGMPKMEVEIIYL
jgi:hypothetical protein